MAVSSRRTSRSPLWTASPFSLSTARTIVGTSARRSARRSGWMEPVMAGPEVSALLRTVWTSSGAISSGADPCGVAAPRLQAARARTKTRAKRRRWGMVLLVLVDARG